MYRHNDKPAGVRPWHTKPASERAPGVLRFLAVVCLVIAFDTIVFTWGHPSWAAGLVIAWHILLFYVLHRMADTLTKKERSFADLTYWVTVVTSADPRDKRLVEDAMAHLGLFQHEYAGWTHMQKVIYISTGKKPEDS